ncbi:unnamed protein product [Arctogadus glacialis]
MGGGGGSRGRGHWGPQVSGSQGGPPDPDLLLLTSDLRLLDEGWVLNGEHGSFGQGGSAPPAVAPPLQLWLRPAQLWLRPSSCGSAPPAVAPSLQLWLPPSSCGSAPTQLPRRAPERPGVSATVPRRRLHTVLHLLWFRVGFQEKPLTAACRRSPH